MNAPDDMMVEFLVECHECLDQMNDELISIESSTESADTMANIFRTLHSIKGSAGFLALNKLESITHHGESLLVQIRDGELAMDTPISDGFFALVDAIREILVSIEETGNEGEQNYTSLEQRLGQLAGGGATAEVAPEADVDDEHHGSHAVADSGESTTENSVDVQGDDLDGTASVPVLEDIVDARISGVSDATVRLDVELLDGLMNQVGELVLARNQILEYSQRSTDPNLIAATHRLNLITSELQASILKTRMRPIRNAWNAIPRVVRDLAQALDKQVDVVTEGADTELDKTLLEAMRDPLTHIVRNAVDHGIESAAERAECGKPANATIVLRAFHQGGTVCVEVSDDGAGINLDRVRERAISRGIVSEAAAQKLSQRELCGLILQPGFSTASKITNVSGRGIGMDVVKNNVESLGGSLDIVTREGQGTTIRLNIPLTLAIVPALMVGAATGRYAIPQVSLKELVRLEGDEVQAKLEFLHRLPIYRLRDQLLPLLYLDEQLSIVPPRTDDQRLAASEVNIVVLEVDGRVFGLVVDDISDTQEIVVKPLGPELGHLPVYAGATIMGDGTVALILDVNGLAEESRILAAQQSQGKSQGRPEVEQDAVPAGAVRSWLIVSGDGERRIAIPLSTVARLEEFPTERIEMGPHGPVVQYRDVVLPLRAIDGRPPRLNGEGKTSVVVYEQDGKSIGIVVDEIVDVLEDASYQSQDESEDTIVIDGLVSEVVNLASIAV